MSSAWVQFRDAAVNSVTGGAEMPTVSDAGSFVGTSLISVAKDATSAPMVEVGPGAPSSPTAQAVKKGLKISVPLLLAAAVAVYFVFRKRGR